VTRLQHVSESHRALFDSVCCRACTRSSYQANDIITLALSYDGPDTISLFVAESTAAGRSACCNGPHPPTCLVSITMVLYAHYPNCGVLEYGWLCLRSSFATDNLRADLPHSVLLLLSLAFPLPPPWFVRWWDGGVDGWPHRKLVQLESQLQHCVNGVFSLHS